MKLRVTICLSGILISAAVLLLSAFSMSLGGHGAHLIEMNGIAGFVIGLIAAGVGATLAAVRGNLWVAAATVVAINVLFALSFLPWYVEHTGKAGLGPTHRHHLWELGHVH
jgi:hypothetical protein